MKLNLRLILLLRVGLVLLTTDASLVSLPKTKTRHDQVHLLLHQAKCSLPVWRTLVLRRILLCIVEVIVVFVTTEWAAPVEPVVAEFAAIVVVDFIILRVVALGDFLLGSGSA
jgi:hypothetical protein